MIARESRDTRSRAAKKPRAGKSAAAPLGTRGLFSIFAIAAVGAVLGAAQVKVQFDARDYAIEARRVQELTQIRRDEVRKLEARIGGLKAGQNLREVAMGPFGMVEPAPESVSAIEVDEDVKEEFAKASREAAEALKTRREAYARAGKEATKGLSAE